MFQSPEKEAANQKAAAASSWLEQIRGSRDAENGDSHKMALEMSSVGKLMALQSLQNSLQLITMGMAASSSNPLERLRHLQQHQQQQQLEAKDPPAPPQSPKEDLLAPPPDNSNYLMGLIRGHAAQAQQAPEYR